MTAARSFIGELSVLAHQMGYAVTNVLVDAQQHGMAQRRKRYFFVAHKVTLDFTGPDHKPRTVYELLENVSDPGFIPPWKDPVQEALMPFCPNHFSFRRIWEEYYTSEGRDRNAQGGIIGRPRLFIHRVDGDSTIGTITGDYFVHPSLDRFMGINELKVLNGFPEDYWLEGKPGGWFSLLSRGVCPPVAEWLADNVARAVDKNESVEDVWQTETMDFR
jgi:site-specific DNA-cytosine methylase